MAKILISSVGVGGRFKNQHISDREYQDACYKIGDTPYPQSRFIASVLYEHFQLDGIIFIGTVRSMWEEVYRFFCETNGVQKDDEYWLDLACKIDNLTHDSDLDSIDLSPIEKVLGERSKCILIKYGLDQDELWENFDRIFQIVELLQPGDEIYIDITHSFRSLSLFLFLTITFIRDLASEKQIKIAGVYYGMLDVSRELNYTPVVDLKPLFDMTSWIKGAYSLQSYGDGYLIAELLKYQNENQLANQIEQLSQSLNINSVNDIKQNSSILRKSLQTQIVKTPFKYLKNILENFVNKFSRSSAKESEYQLELSGWYFDNHRYSTGYITLAEAIITYLCEINRKNIKSKGCREEMKDLLHKRENITSDLAQLYLQVNPIRKSIAHALLDISSGNDRGSLSNAINNAKNYQQTAKQIFSTGTLNKS
ncbi:TIGR02221 family CRISPR-associated protein [Trichormus sp. NMC-1]|uniref:TIGR02221 family CRISPR-associated protein n=1 Tax=Trichormus sp. NMC-1 TaxID=1853259 RepID=UPI0008DC217F|nr:TIGR02221 family CRISPR-associated protein [Trichormus sp. NMC-1]